MKKALIVATVPSMIGQFNMNNIEILLGMGYQIDVACDFKNRSVWDDKKVNSFISELKRNYHINCVQIDFSRNMFNVFNHIKSYDQIKKLKKENYKLVHCHTPIASAIIRIAFRKSKCKMIYTAHGFHFYKGNNCFKNFLFKSIEKICGRFTDVIITINKEDYEAAKEFKLRKNGKVKYIPGIGINIDKIQNINEDKNGLCRELNIPKDSILLLSVGELSKRKNQAIVISALQDLPEKIHYIICGRGELESDYSELSKSLGIEKRVHLLGFRTNVIEIVKSCDIFVFPSLQEGLPVALMEAMACGIPCIASKIRGNVDLINGENGMLIQENKDSNYKEAILKILNDRQLKKKMCENAKSDSLKYSDKVIIGLMTKIYGEN